MRIAFGSASFLFGSPVFSNLFILNNQLGISPVVFNVHTLDKENLYYLNIFLQKYIILNPCQSFTQKNINNAVLENIYKQNCPNDGE